VAAVDLARFITHAGLAVNLLEAGAAPPRLAPDDAVLDALQVGPVDRQRLARAEISEQVELLRPYVTRFLQGQQEAKMRAAMSAAGTLVGQLRREARHDAGSTWMPLAPLAALTAIPAFKVLRFETPAVPWTFSRAHLSRILHSLTGCTDTDARLESGRFVLTYVPRAGGRGQIVLLDQAIPDWETGILRVLLTAPVAAPQTVPERRQAPPPPRRRREVEPPRHWLVDAAYALVDGLL